MGVLFRPSLKVVCWLIWSRNKAYVYSNMLYLSLFQKQNKNMHASRDVR